MEAIGKIIVGLGVAAIVVGGLLMLAGKAGISSVPGDMSFGKGNWRVYLPFGTSILLSIVLTILLTIFSRSR